MANEVLQKVGGQIRFFVTGSFSPATAKTNMTIGTPTDVVMALAALANGSAIGSAKFDFGEKRAASYELKGCVDFTDETPTQDKTVDYYLATSGTLADGTDNIGGTDGVTGAVPSNGLGSLTLADFLALCQYIGPLRIHNGASVQNGFVGECKPTNRYGQLIVVNNGGDAFEDDDVEMHQVLNPIVDEIQ